MRVAILTSSRADYGIYRPLLKAMKEDDFFDPEIIVFGTHLSKFHGLTITQIEKDGYKIYDRIECLALSDSPTGISSSFGLTCLKFSEFWRKNQNRYDLVFCLGDRFEMCAAVFSGIPFNIKFAHLHGGETTLGAIDNIYRHSISLASAYHFVALEENLSRLQEIIQDHNHIYHVGSLSLDNLQHEDFLTMDEFEQQFNIDLSKRSVLVTFHPETRENDDTELLETIRFTIDRLLEKWQVIVTMPNADTHGTRIRQLYEQYSARDGFKPVENFGTRGYFTCMKNVDFLVGNSSSGIIEAASLGKYVLNIGDRQRGRISGENVHHCSLDTDCIQSTISKLSELGDYRGENIYGDGYSADKIISVLKRVSNV